MLLALLVGLACGFVGSIPIAGPAAVLIVERGLGGFKRSAMAMALGTAVAEGGYALLAFLGMTAALTRFPLLLPVSRIVGAVILLGVGLFFALRPERPAKPAEGGPVVAGRRARDGLWVGFVVTAVNPTLLASWTAVVTVLHSYGLLPIRPLDAFPFGGGVATGATAWFWSLLIIIHKLHKNIAPRTMDRVVRVIGWIIFAAGLAFVIKLLLAW